MAGTGDFALDTRDIAATAPNLGFIERYRIFEVDTSSYYVGCKGGQSFAGIDSHSTVGCPFWLLPSYKLPLPYLTTPAPPPMFITTLSTCILCLSTSKFIDD
ncbi:hypothetical protein RSAG8_12996, partial [Rhizoctonia solani AG-8 WAC10335]